MAISAVKFVKNSAFSGIDPARFEALTDGLSPSEVALFKANVEEDVNFILGLIGRSSAEAIIKDALSALYVLVEAVGADHMQSIILNIIHMMEEDERLSAAILMDHLNLLCDDMHLLLREMRKL